MATNRLIDEIAVGDGASATRRLTADDLYIFARASGSLNPLHLPGVDWSGDGTVDQPVAPPLWIASVLSGLVGNRLPGPGAVWRTLDLEFRAPVAIGEEIVATVTVTAKTADAVRLALRVARMDGTTVAEGHGLVAAPTRKIDLPHVTMPDVTVDRHEHFERLIAVARRLPPLATAVAAPDDPHSLAGALAAARIGLIRPILVGDRARIDRAAAVLAADLSTVEVIDVPDDSEAAARAVALVHEGRAQAVMKGHLHSDLLLHHVVKKEGGLRGTRRLSHVFVMDVPGRAAPLFISDAAINIAPDLATKVDIVQNAIDLARALGIARPRVGILSAVETVNPAIPSTLDAAVLSKMAERGQITGADVDGPLAMDNAVDLEAARTKGITSLVAGRAEVLIVPNLEAGNMLAKELTFLAGAEAAGLVVGARVPIVLTSRADDEASRLASAAVAVLQAHFAATGRPATA